MQKRMIDAMAAIPGVKSVGWSTAAAIGCGLEHELDVFTDETTDLRPSNAAAKPFMYNISPEYFHAAGTPLLAGRDLHMA